MDIWNQIKMLTKSDLIFGLNLLFPTPSTTALAFSSFEIFVWETSRNLGFAWNTRLKSNLSPGHQLKDEFVNYTLHQLKNLFLAARRKRMYKLSLMPFASIRSTLTAPAIIALLLLALHNRW